MSNLAARILLHADKDLLLNFEKRRLEATMTDPMEAEMASWNARWRGEALDHYLPQGWSFACFEDEALQGYVLAQPLLFHRARTQTLWVEHLAYVSSEAAKLVIDTVHRWARDKHFQCLLLENNDDTHFILGEWKQAAPLEAGWIELKSAKY